MLTNSNLIITIIIMATTTFFTRLVPFIIFPSNKETPKYILYLGDVLPYSIIGMLIIYCLKNISLLTFPYGMGEIIAILFVIIVHVWKKNTLLSICGGTILYMFLVQTIFI
ncbi:branched-chain amino acid transporter AzlD [Alkalibaculum sp. M08DMB]|uniref:Branched-chain amino acid transporter AzlD n=1 Tax=Alkalibaculum sporogenes TaxID=2655001 RepID=A0A6A7K8J5_9FIRM|nr:AzlD domain-containing protein [Alkalibaculum sporogenes]MPW25712.1 branched-chain amino acid transporter AzlD [Alkalibaculum sporogenes]